MRSERELSSEELEFIASVTKKTEDLHSAETKTRQGRGLLRRIFRARNFAIASAVLTLLACFVFIYTVESIPASYGGLDALRLLATVGESDEWGGMLSQVGFGWVNDFLNFYDSRWIILAIIASVGLVITLIFAIWAIFSRGDDHED